jgi:hypothetical protein
VLGLAALVGYLWLSTTHAALVGAHPRVLTAIVVTLAGAVIGKIGGLLYHAVRRRRRARVVEP